MSARFLCFDLASHTGWASDDGAQLRCGLWDLTEPFGKTRADRVESLARRFTLMLDEFAPTLVAIEAPLIPQPHKGGVDEHGKSRGAMRFNIDSLRLSWALAANVEQACYRRRVDYREINTTEIKKIATGHGNRWKGEDGNWIRPDKKMVLDRMRFRYPDLEIKTHDVADALAMVTLLRAEQRGAGAPAATAVVPAVTKRPARPRVFRGRRRATA